MFYMYIYHEHEYIQTTPYKFYIFFLFFGGLHLTQRGRRNAFFCLGLFLLTFLYKLHIARSTSDKQVISPLGTACFSHFLQRDSLLQTVSPGFASSLQLAGRDRTHCPDSPSAFAAAESVCCCCRDAGACCGVSERATVSKTRSISGAP